ncbi:MAG: ClpX C4-type zinc finger protein [Chloroflexota bacterium]
MVTIGSKPTAEAPYCSFCGKAEPAIRRLIAGPDCVFICDACVRDCGSLLKEQDDDNARVLRGDR